MSEHITDKLSDDLQSQCESILDPMDTKGKYPDVELTKFVTSDMEEIEPIDRDAKDIINRIEFDEQQPMPDHVNGFMEGHRLLFKGLGNSREKKNSYLLYFYFIGAFLLLATLLSVYYSEHKRIDNYLIPVIAAILITWAIIATFIQKKRSSKQFVVFDRTSGNVLFTARGRWSDIVVPFEKVGMFTEHYMGKGSMIYSVNLDCQMRPKGKRGRRTETILPMGPRDHDEVISQWAFINRFMDNSRPIAPV